jgi:hypothetical protein
MPLLTHPKAVKWVTISHWAANSDIRELGFLGAGWTIILRAANAALEDPMKKKSPKWPDVASVDVLKIPVRKSRKGQKDSSRMLAKQPISVAHHHSTSGEDGEAMHWIRQFLFEGGPEYVHGPSYHTKNAKGLVQNAQFASMLPSEEYAALIGKAIEAGIIVLPPQTLKFLQNSFCPATNKVLASREEMLDEPDEVRST